MSETVLTKMLKLHEGVRKHPYIDSVGKITIGVGRNLKDVGLRDVEIYYLLSNDIAQAEMDLKSKLPWASGLDDVRQMVLIDMCFNMGIKGLLGFTATLELVEKGDYETASLAMLQSKWAEQVGQRAHRLAKMMKTGQVPSELA